MTLTVKGVYNNTGTCKAQPDSSGTLIVYLPSLASQSYDNCAVWSYSPTVKLYTGANLGNNDLTITVKDWSNNASTCVSVVTVVPYGALTDPGDRTNKIENMEKEEKDVEVSLYPNPTSGNATLTVELPAEQEFTIRVFDSSGRMVFSRDGTGVAGENNLPVRLTGVVPGVYLIDFQSEELKAQKELVIQE